MHSTAKRIQRQENILYSLKKFDYMTRSQLQTIHKLGGKRNACRVLQRLEDEELVSSFRSDDGEKVFHLNKEGAEMVDGKPRRKTHLVNHYLMRNQLYIHCGMPSTWENEIQVNNKIVADAMFRKNGLYLVEADNLQTFKANVMKIRRYKEIAKKSEDFTLIWITSTHARKIRLERRMSDLNHAVYVYSDLL